MKRADFKWFLNGKLNASVNCVDRHAEADPGRVALLWERDEPNQHVPVTYAELATKVGQLANALRRRGVGRGDVVAIYMPVTPDTVAAMMACARIGAVHTVIFAGFSAEAIATRIQVTNLEIICLAVFFVIVTFASKFIIKRIKLFITRSLKELI